MNNKVTDLILEKKNNIQKQPHNMSEESLISSEKTNEYSSDEESDDDIELEI
jgi:hypothetical protein